jgi:pyridoxine 5'-phosphate synthase PdxJ
VAAIETVEELNIGHSIVSNAIYHGLSAVVRAFRVAMDAGRAS